MYSQRDKRWGHIKIGLSNSRIKDYGCFITALGMMINKNPKQVNEILTKARAYNYDLVNSPKAAKALGLEYKGITTTPPKFMCPAEVDFSPAPGIQHHFVVFNGNCIYDPWTGKKESLKKYRIINYRLFKQKSMNKNFKKIFKYVQKLLEKDFGDNPNDKETKIIKNDLEDIKRTIKLLSMQNSQLRDLVSTGKKKIIGLETVEEIQATTIDELEDKIKNQTAQIGVLERRNKDLKEELKSVQGVIDKNAESAKVYDAILFVIKTIKNRIK